MDKTPVSIVGVTMKDASKVMRQLRHAGFLAYYNSQDKSLNLDVTTHGRDKTREILEAAYDKAKNPAKYKKSVAVEAPAAPTTQPDPKDDMIKRLAEALKQYRKEYKAFRSKPIGTPDSFARQTQDARIAFEDAVDLLLKEVNGS